MGGWWRLVVRWHELNLVVVGWGFEIGWGKEEVGEMGVLVERSGEEGWGKWGF